MVGFRQIGVRTNRCAVGRQPEWGDTMRQTPHALRYVLPLALLTVALLSACSPRAGAISRSTASTPPVAASPAVSPTTAPDAPLSPIAADLARRAQQAIGSLGQQVTATYDPAKKTATITVTLTGDIPFTDPQIASAHTHVELIAYWVMSSAWTSGEPLNEVTALVLGPIQDEYANIITNWYGVAVVEASTARSIAWRSVDPYTVWSRYDQAMLRPSFDLVD